MIEVLVSGGIFLSFCGIWYNTHKKNQTFNRHVKMTGEMLDHFVKINEHEFMDYELHNAGDTPQIKKKYIDTSIVHQIGKDIDTGYDFYHIKVQPGYNTLLHRHNFSSEFFYVLKGQIEISCVTEDIKPLTKGQYFYVADKDFHCVTAHVESEFIVIAKPPLIVRV